MITLSISEVVDKRLYEPRLDGICLNGDHPTHIVNGLVNSSTFTVPVDEHIYRNPSLGGLQRCSGLHSMEYNNRGKTLHWYVISDLVF